MPKTMTSWIQARNAAIDATAHVIFLPSTKRKVAPTSMSWEAPRAMTYPSAFHQIPLGIQLRKSTS